MSEPGRQDPRVSDADLREEIATFDGDPFQSGAWGPFMLSKGHVLDWLLDLRDCRARSAALEAALRRLIGAIEALAVEVAGGPSANWTAIDASQDAARGLLHPKDSLSEESAVSTGNVRPERGGASSLEIRAQCAYELLALQAGPVWPIESILNWCNKQIANDIRGAHE